MRPTKTAAVESEVVDEESREPNETTPPPTIRPTTTQRPTTTDVDLETAQIVCDSTTEFLDENSDARVIEAIGFGTAWREALVEKGYEPSTIGERSPRRAGTATTTRRSWDMAGSAPWRTPSTTRSIDGMCSARGDYGGVLTMSSVSGGGTYSVELELLYVAGNVVEHQTSEYVHVEPGGNGVAFEFYVPDVPAGGECDVSLVSVRPEQRSGRLDAWPAESPSRGASRATRQDCIRSGIAGARWTSVSDHELADRRSAPELASAGRRLARYWLHVFCTTTFSIR